ncbi:MAG: hypothetical protein GY874_18430 [Desulfobacteraceae bacterium]|nr:hypothetical protein [Desulfobacteraceae bacterium]
MKLCSKAELSRMVDRSAPYISKALKEGSIGIVGNGRIAKVDLDHPLTIEFIETCKQNDQDKSIEEKVTPALQTNSTDVDNINLNALTDGTDIERLDKKSVERLKTIEQVLSIRQKRAADRGKLIERDTVARVFAELYTIDVNEFRTMGPSLAAPIASAAGVDDPEKILKIEQIIEEAVFKILKHVKRVTNNFLLSIDAEQI